MKSLAVDLRSGPRLPPWSWRALVLLWGVVITAGAVLFWLRLDIDRLRRSRELALVQAQMQVARRQEPVKSPPQAYLASERQFLLESDPLWPDLLRAVEATKILGVDVTQIDLHTSEQRMRLELSISDHAALLGYVAALNGAISSGHWTIVQTSVGTSSGPPTSLTARIEVSFAGR